MTGHEDLTRERQTGLARIEDQFGLGGATWLKRIVAGVVMFVLGSARVPRPRTSNEEMRHIPYRMFVQSNGDVLHYLETGEPHGKPLIFVHGTPGGGYGFADYLLNPQAGAACLAIDRPGFAASAPAEAVTSLSAQAKAIAELIRARNSGPAILVGHSYGAPVAMQTAVDVPDAVGALVILAGSLDPSLEHVPFVQRLGDVWPFRTLLPRALRNANRELIALKGELERLAPRLGEITIPVVIVHGTADKLVPYSNVAFMQSRMTCARLKVVTLQGGDHFLPWNAIAEVEAAIAEAYSACGTNTTR